MIALRSTVRPAKDVLDADLEDEKVILNVRTGRYYGLNPVGSRIWQLLQQPVSVDALLGTVLAEYDVAPDRGEQDLVALLEDLAAAGLVEVGPGPAR